MKKLNTFIQNDNMNKIEINHDGTLKSDLSDSEKRLIELINGAEPKTPDEIKMVKEIQEAKKNGQIISIPGM